MPLRKILSDPQLSRLILDQALDAFIAIDEQSRVIEWNQRAEQTFGWTRDEILGQSLTETLMPERYREAHLAGMARYLSQGESRLMFRRVEMVALRRDGKEIPVELAIAPIVGSDRPLFSASVRDLTQQKELQRDLERHIEITRAILDGMADAVAVADLSERVLLINPAARRLLNHDAPADGQPALSLLCQNLHLADGQSPCPADEQPIARALRGEQVNGWVGLIRPTPSDRGIWISANARPLISKDGTQLGAVVVYHDITELQKRQQILTQQTDLLRKQIHASDESVFQESWKRYQLLVETATEFAMIVTDPKGTIVSWNTGAERILGLSAGEIIGQPISSIYSPEERREGHPWHELERAIIAGRAEERRWHIRKDGTRFWASGVITPLWDTRSQLLGFTQILRDQTSQRLAEEQMQFLANHDPLTGLPNRVHLSDRLHKAIAHSQRSRKPIAVLLLDLDGFKGINDTLGHHAGDLLLKQVAQRLQSSLRETDFIARLGGDEFVVIQTGEEQPYAAEVLARKLIDELGRAYRLEQHEVQVGASIGIAIYPRDADNTVDLMKRSDAALYQAKSRGRGRYWFHARDLLTRARPDTRRRDNLRRALAEGNLRLYYQPQIDLHSWHMRGVEALLRWQSGQELVLPAEINGMLLEEGMACEVGWWVLRNACERIKRWRTCGLADLRVAINCSDCQLKESSFPQTVCTIMDSMGLPRTCLELEISESMLAAAEVKEQVARLRFHGIHITVDNYGTGTTPLAELKDLDVDGMKIDRQLVQHLPHRHKDCAIALAVIQLAHNLGIKVAAGGVETPEQLAYLKAQDCNTAQGFIFSPPVPADEFEELLISDHWSRIHTAPG